MRDLSVARRRFFQGRMRIVWTMIFSLATVAPQTASTQSLVNPLPPLRKQAEMQQEWLKERLERILPGLMREQEVSMWVVPMREYNEDPVFSSIVSATTFAARRRTIYVFFDRGGELGVERLALGGGTQGGLYAAYRDTTLERNAELWGTEQWRLLKKVISERDPKNIAVNISHLHAFSDGLSAGEWEQLQEAIGPEFAGRIVRRDRLALDLITIRTDGMLEVYKLMMQAAHDIIAKAFSGDVITPGKTTTQDVVWWLRQTTHDLGFSTWFQPSVDIQRRGADLSRESNPIIERGDVLHCDFGITAMGLNTDTQHMGYVLRQGELEPPAGIRNALSNSNKLQDIVVSNLRIGRTGNEVLLESLAEMKSRGIQGSVYSHPIGEHGHGAGPLIGLWDRQEGIPGRGDVPVLPQSWYSVELQAKTPVQEWGQQLLTSAQEEDVYVTSDGEVHWVLDRQNSYHLIR